MRALRTVLVVSPTGSVAQSIAAAARLNRYAAVIVKDFETAKAHLAVPPHLLVTELKLGQYNGLHLALRAGASGIPAVVVADSAFKGDVEDMHAIWASPDSVSTGELGSLMVRLLQGRGAEGDYFWHDTDREGLADWHLPVAPPLFQ